MFARARSLTVRHIGRKRPALRDLDFDWEEGERLLLLGPSGAGKSTLALCLDGLIPHALDAHWENGTLTVGGRDTRSATLAELTGDVGVLFQDPETQLVMLETDDEIAFGLENLGLPPKEMVERIAEARASTGLGPETPRRLDTLSGGTKQRVALASLLAMRPRALVLDEPTANLDPIGAREVVTAFAALAIRRERSFLVIEHRIDPLLRFIDRVAVLGDDGRLALAGDPENVFMGRADEPADLLVERWPRGASARRDERAPGRRITVAARAVAYRYRAAEREAVNDASLELREGEIAAVVGANGAGKSTLGLLLAGVLRPSRGAVEVTGDVAYVFQYPERGFLAATVRDEVRYSATIGRRIARDPDALLERFGLARLAEANPHSLSHGEKRRLSVASALVTSPAVLILDEPTFGQDLRNTRELVSILREERDRGTTVVLITHDLSLVAEVADRAIAMAGGAIGFDGSPDRLFQRPDLARFGLALPAAAGAFARARERDPAVPPLTGLDAARGALASLVPVRA
ncbi:MAG: ATP-binding cassette domain-containing protein [Chloroflexi bacterium]|nr:MAG: ATP-binding cassette domain-containing protein [Chloroflexota bacterium]